MIESVEELVRADVRGARRVRLAIGALLAGIAAFAIAIAAANTRGVQRAEIIALFAAIAGVPGLLLVRSAVRMSPGAHPLLAAVRVRGAIAAVALGYEQVGFGHRARVDVELADGSRHRLTPPRGRERELVAALEALRCARRHPPPM